MGPASRTALAAGPITSQKDVPYETVNGQTLAMDVYLPHGAGPHPGVLLAHPGQFRAGGRAHLAPLARFLAVHGYVAFTIDYRLAPQFPYPAAVQDAIQALAYMRAHADEFNLDPTRIGAAGTSAGGTIAGSLGTSCGRGTTGGQVAAVASLSGPMDLLNLVQQAPTTRGPVFSYAVGHRTPGINVDALLTAASPAAHVSPDSAPFLMALNPAEPFPAAQYTEMAGLLRAAHVPVEFFRPPPGSYFHAVNVRTLRFLNHYVADYTGTPSAPARACVVSAGTTPATTPPPTPSPTPSATSSPAPTPPASSPPAHRGSGGSKVFLFVGIGVAVVVVLGLWARAYFRRPTF
ncbi:MAG: alpha/beta hydrolase [Actinomycetota bacterium]|nr:alpha/beta hydrolase [Actinomycetota bacterium]